MYSNHNRSDGLVQPSLFVVMTGQIDMGFFPRCYSLGSKVDSQLRSHLREPALYLFQYTTQGLGSASTHAVFPFGARREMGQTRGGSCAQDAMRIKRIEHVGPSRVVQTTRSSGEHTRYTYLACSIDRCVVTQRGRPWCHTSSLEE